MRRVSRKKERKVKPNDWVTEKSEAHNTQDQEKGVGSPLRQKQDNKGQNQQQKSTVRHKTLTIDREKGTRWQEQSSTESSKKKKQKFQIMDFLTPPLFRQCTVSQPHGTVCTIYYGHCCQAVTKGNSYTKISHRWWLNDLPFVEGRAVEWQARREPLTGRMVLCIFSALHHVKEGWINSGGTSVVGVFHPSPASPG